MTEVPHVAEAALHAEAAITLFSRAFPEHGLKIVVPPPSPGGAKRTANVSIWRRGEAQAVSWSAATPAAALLRAVQNEISNRRDQERCAACETCNGIGWYVSIEGGNEICRHARLD